MSSMRAQGRPARNGRCESTQLEQCLSVANARLMVVGLFYRMITAKLRQDGWQVNFKRIYRLWRREGFKVPQKTRKKRRLGHSGNSCVRRRAEHRDHIWTWDFIHDRTITGKPLKWLGITDEFTRECLALEVDRSITSDRVLDTLTNLFLTRGVQRHIRSDSLLRACRTQLARTLACDEVTKLEDLYAANRRKVAVVGEEGGGVVLDGSRELNRIGRFQIVVSSEFCGELGRGRRHGRS